jgi:hypothetical protein
MKANPMSHKLFTDARLFSFIDRVDADAVATAREEGCLQCDGPLDRADFDRKPRSIGAGLGGGPRRRPSLCCRKDGCRRRKTPPQLLFLGRHVYLSVVVILVAAMCQGPTASRLGVLERALGVSRRTIRRWLAWWRDVFPASAGWRERRSWLVPPVSDLELPWSLIDRLAAVGDADAFGQVLRLVIR